MDAKKYAKVMRLRAAYMKGVNNAETRDAHNIYTRWTKDGVAREYRQKYAKLSSAVKVHEINKILATCLPSEDKIKEITEIMKR